VELSTNECYSRMEVKLHESLTSTPDGSKWPASGSGSFTSGKRSPGDRWTGGSVGLRIGTDERKQIHEWRVLSSGIQRRIVHCKSVDVSEEHVAELSLLPTWCWFLVRLIFRPWRCRRHFPSKRRLNFNGLHGVISYKTELFITTAVRTSNPTSIRVFISATNWAATVHQLPVWLSYTHIPRRDILQINAVNFILICILPCVYFFVHSWGKNFRPEPHVK
jgi:hypothetical protein